MVSPHSRLKGKTVNSRWSLWVLTKYIDDLCGAFAVWAATDEAKFLHGRFAWASWDVEELATGELRKRIDQDPYFLRTAISGLNSTSLA